MLLIFPPQAPVFSPHLALPQLRGYLKENGYDAEIIDLNILFINYLLQDFSDQFSNKQVKNAVQSLRDPTLFYSITDYISSIEYISWALDVQKRKCGFRCKLFGAEYGFSEFSSKEITENIGNLDVYLFPIYEKFLQKSLLENKVIGISISYAAQLIPALSLCRFVRKANSNIKIVLGGSHVSAIYLELKNSCINYLFDYIISGPGEKKLLEIAKKEELSCSTSLMGDSADGSSKKLYVDWPEMGAYKYLSPELVIPLCVSEGCYWGKCSFCNHESLHGDQYRIASIEETVRYISKIQRQTGARCFSFVDSVIPITWLENLSHYLKDRGIIWDACVRFDQVNCDYSKLFEGGCRLLRFGLESGSQCVLDAMNKGTKVRVAADILKSTFEAGIGTFVFFFTGFPGETEHDAQETISFLEENGKYINFANGGGLFYLGKGSPIYKEPSHYNIDILPNDLYDMSLEVPYVSHSGMSRVDAEKMAFSQHLSVQKLGQNPTGIISRIYDIHDLLYVAHYGNTGLKKISGER